MTCLPTHCAQRLSRLFGRSSFRGPCSTAFVLRLTLLSYVLCGVLHGQTGFGPGRRTVNDAHNCYPYDGRWNDRIERALATGTPVSIEQDLQWYVPAKGAPGVVVSHGGELSSKEPRFAHYFFDRARPVVEAALRNPDHSQWPIITLNLDFKTEQPELLRAVWAILQEHREWLTVAERTADENAVQPLHVGPVLVLNGPSDAQQKIFYDDVPVGARLLTFAAVQADREANPDTPYPPATNYRRWANNSWKAVEPGGQQEAGPWTSASRQRLLRLVEQAHQQGLWIRFYTLDGTGDAQLKENGWFRTYDFRSPDAARQRWLAAIHAGVDYLASDQYEQLGRVIHAEQRSRAGASYSTTASTRATAHSGTR